MIIKYLAGWIVKCSWPSIVKVLSISPLANMMVEIRHVIDRSVSWKSTKLRYKKNSLISLRLVNEMPRGTKRYSTFKKMRPASERSNSTMKEDLKILDKPRWYSVSLMSWLMSCQIHIAQNPESHGTLIYGANPESLTPKEPISSRHPVTNRWDNA